MKRPPLPAKSVDGFDKKEWVHELKMMKKETLIEERDRYRPLLCLKRDLGEFMLECEKQEKRDHVGLRKEMD